MYDGDAAIIASWAPHLLAITRLPDGRLAGINVRMYNTQILVGLERMGYRDAY